MKELSIEEKAKAYDSIFERLKEMYNNNKTNVAARLIYERYFPELKESENIKIIKAIKYGLDHVFTNNTTVFEVTKEQCLSWLEKQGEQKPLFKKGDTVFWDGEEFNILDVTKDSYNVGGYIIPICRQNELLLKQKPAWSEMAKWQKEHLWKPADGDDLPEIDKEVVVLIKYDAQRNIHDEEYPTYRVGFGHRPNPNGWDGKNIDTNEVTHYTPKLYDKGGWNAPNIVYWLDTKLPYEENKIDKEIEP